MALGSSGQSGLCMVRHGFQLYRPHPRPVQAVRHSYVTESFRMHETGPCLASNNSLSEEYRESEIGL